ncbi:iron complex outermembrane receptor protein [Brevundimonas nasdae]|uniref:TonB-dependent receptor plug domain-containing protein n=1 Tax=Brevundimonas nasdae TaxID=172043 RepID=UPI0019132094|nr:TonB-dependent receptor [Brevundimonas nasdae]MBK6023553.1 TonB-dependent receptor [Brevundimonas nasdae]MDQ0450204.1 iron complex outermembrane receptor protein [Brevundimonas nasdae]
MRQFTGHRALLFAAASTAVLTIATGAAAQSAGAPSASDVDEVVVTGTRVPGRTRLDTLVPVDVVTSEALQQRGTTELASQLAVAVPSIAFPRPSLTDGTDSVRPATLRGQGPDQTLVLVNGIRRHVSAQVNTNGTVGRGSAPVDLNAIPSSALDRVEVLRDGASAQYGSDAIAGVINLRLREASSGGGASATYGSYLSSVNLPNAGKKDFTDGKQLTVSAWQGFALGADGFLTVSAEYRDRDYSNRADLNPTAVPQRITGRFGDPESTDWSIYANAGKPLNASWSAYGWAGYQERSALSAASYRNPLTQPTQSVPEIFPDGYLPLIGVDTQDLTANGGVRGQAGGFDIDVSLGYGRNALDYSVHDTINASYGAQSKTDFYAGSVTYDQLVFGIDANRAYEVGLAGPLNVAFGLEARRETYEIGAGEPQSYDRGPVAGKGSASQGYGGFAPSNVLSKNRSNVGVYLDVEGELVENFTASAALRYENYSDFGDTLTGKVAGRYDFNPHLAVRGAVSTGFRAPSLQQQYFTQTSITLVPPATPGGPTTFTESGTFPSNSVIGRALGGTDLEPETSVNYSLGTVWRYGGFELTIDAYQINVEDRIILSGLLSGNRTAAAGTNAKIIADLLDSVPGGATSARFFINGVDSKTKGIDIVGRYRWNSADVGRFDFTVAGNINDFKVTRYPTTRTFSSTTVLPQEVDLFDRRERVRFERGVPQWKVNFQTDWSYEAFGVTARTTFYGDTLNAGTPADGSGDVRTGVRGVVDLEGRYTLSNGVVLALGADNLLDTYPKKTPAAFLGSTGGSPYSSFSPFGFNGRFVYGRVSVKW